MPVDYLAPFLLIGLPAMSGTMVLFRGLVVLLFMIILVVFWLAGCNDNARRKAQSPANK